MLLFKTVRSLADTTSLPILSKFPDCTDHLMLLDVFVDPQTYDANKIADLKWTAENEHKELATFFKTKNDVLQFAGRCPELRVAERFRNAVHFTDESHIPYETQTYTRSV
jgi:hypothetical protein